jgi:hypothetical protein
MRMLRHGAALARPIAAASMAAVAIGAFAAPEQLTSSTGDSSVQRIGPPSTGIVAIRSSGDLKPADPGNADGSSEVYLLRLSDRSLRQLTNSNADSSASWITDRGLVFVSSDGDLTPLAPGNADGSVESWVFRPGTRAVPGSLTQVSASSDDTSFRTFWEKGGRAYFTSQGDLTPAAPGNADGSREIYAYDPGADRLAQITSSTDDSTFRTVLERGPACVIESRGDLTPGRPGNTDGSREMYLVDLRTLAMRQVTSSPADVRYRGHDAAERFIAFECDGDLTPADAVQAGNADGSQEVFVYDRRARRLRQMTHSQGDSSFAGFVPHSKLIAIESREDLVPATLDTPGNADRSREVFTVDLRNGRIAQETASLGDSTLEGFAGARNSLAAIVSDGDLDGGTAAVGVDQVFLREIGADRGSLRRMTNGATASSFHGFDPSGRSVVIESRADLVPAGADSPGNADLSREVFVARTTGRPRMYQLTASPEDSSFAGFTGDGRTFLVNSRGDFDPAGPGNADGSLEVFAFRHR